MRSGAELPSRPGIALSAVVPCCDEAEGNVELYTRVVNVCRTQAAQFHGIVLVNYGSKDATRDHIFRLAQRDRHVVAINLARNYGHEVTLGAALPRRSAGRGDRRLCRAVWIGVGVGTFAHDAGACSASYSWITART